MWWRRGGERWRHSVPSTTTHILHTAANATDERALAASIDALSTAGTYLATDSHGMVARSISREKRNQAVPDHHAVGAGTYQATDAAESSGIIIRLTPRRHLHRSPQLRCGDGHDHHLWNGRLHSHRGR
jgi:hypothetical protein